jgi:tetratricopeptide (TPR) repeat protein
VVIGWDGADWDYLRPRIEAGALPELRALLRESRTGSLRTIHPPLSPIVWTTMMTGRDPLDHGILDFTRFHPVSRAREPITSDERRAPALWSLASAAGRRVAVFGMWATYPAEAVDGVIVSDRLISFQSGAAPDAPGVVFPNERTAWARAALGRAERDAAPGALADPAKEEALRRILVETAVYDDLAAEWYREYRPDLTILYVQATDAVGHVFAPFRPPRRPGIRPEDVDRYGAVADRVYDEADRRLGRWRKLAEETGARIVLVSDHGFAWGEDRPAPGTSDAAATAGRWHRDEGIFLIAGQGIAASPVPGTGDVAQVAPTVLALLGLPPTPGMPEPLAGLAAAGPPVEPEVTPVSGVSGELVDDEAIARLRALGYVGGSEPRRAPEGSGTSTRTAGSYGNEGLILEERGRVEDARHAYERALAVDPGHAATLWNLSRLSGDETLTMRALAAGSPDAAQAMLTRAKARLQAGDCRRALQDLRAVGAAQSDSPIPPAAEALALLCLDDKAGALAALRRSLALDPDQPELRRMVDALR